MQGWRSEKHDAVVVRLDSGADEGALSRHSDTAKAFAYMLKQGVALNLYCSSTGWAEIDNNIAENALRGVALGRKTGCSQGQTAVVSGQQSCTR